MKNQQLNRSALSLLLLIITCCLLSTTSAPASYHSNSDLSSHYFASTQGCDSLTFSDVSPVVWTCMKGRLAEYNFSVSSDPRGEISGNGVKGDFSWDKRTKTLAITVKQTSFYSCEKINKEINNYVDSCRDTEKVRLLKRDASVDVWRIDDPNVKQRETVYHKITFRRGDTVSVSAGGCVQHGGPGKTWKLYVAPAKPSPNQFFYGLIRLPGMSDLIKLKEFMEKYAQGYRIPSDASGEMSLHLGYEDFRYSDNGYWGRDEGYNEQCKGVENAWVQLTITHSQGALPNKQH